jgi:hypothetical protein
MSERDTDDEFVRVLRGGDDDVFGEVIQSWTWSGDPLMAMYDSAQDAMCGADRYYDRSLEWWDEEPECWMADRPEGYDFDGPITAKETA